MFHPRNSYQATLKAKLLDAAAAFTEAAENYARAVAPFPDAKPSPTDSAVAFVCALGLAECGVSVQPQPPLPPADAMVEPKKAPPAPSAPAAAELTFSAFREANVRRCLKWHPEGIESWSTSDWITAVVGELGELASLIKMRNRERDGLSGNKFSPTDQQIADEAADVFTYLDLFCAREGIDLGRAAATKFNVVSERVGFPDRIVLAPIVEMRTDLGACFGGIRPLGTAGDFTMQDCAGSAGELGGSMLDAEPCATPGCSECDPPADEVANARTARAVADLLETIRRECPELFPGGVTVVEFRRAG